MNKERIEKLRKQHKFFWWLTLIAFINTATAILFHWPEGIFSIILAIPFNLFGASAAGLIMTITGMIGNFWLIWLVVAFVLNTKIKRLNKNENIQNSHS